MRIAVIDIGTNTTRLLVAEVSGGGYREIDRKLRFTRLGAGIDEGKQIAPTSLKRTLSAVAEYCALCGEYGVDAIRAAGTSAVRDATNREELLDGVAKLTGGEAEVLSGTEEARLTFMGATADLGAPRCFVVDIGGGSTEFVLGEPGEEPRASASADIGSVRLTERHLRSDPPATEEILILESAIDAALEEVAVELGEVSGARLVGVAGTVTSLAALHLDVKEYRPDDTHGLRMARSQIDRLYRRLASSTLEERRREPALPPGRADVIVAGASILARIMRRFGFDSVRVSERDILDGLVLDTLRSKRAG